MSEQPINADAFRDFERAAHDEIAEGYRRFFTAVTDYAVEPLLDAAAVRADRAAGPDSGRRPWGGGGHWR